ncbi:helix-turn-helix domain-containing protein [Falsihalocynthiibacter arcticus]|uniref:helix-turn-helix domain-containing protein n=1 Tax=Falsihalocynthiibacter arcticus TaxID=1579316 RepID=UPI0030033112
MSNVVSALVQKRKVGSPTRKAILMFMASCASDDGTGIWSSKATMARDLEMGKRTVQVSIDDLVAHRLVSEVGTRACAHGFTVEYRMNLDVIRALEPTNPNAVNKGKFERWSVDLKDSEQAGASPAPVQEMHPTGAEVAPHGVQDLHPNLTGTIQEPSTRTSAQEEMDSEFEKIWLAYPPDRQRGKSTCKKCFREAMTQGISAGSVLMAIRYYARETDGYSRSKVCFSDNWFKARRWEDHANDETKAAGNADVAAFWADRIKTGKRVHGNPISAGLAREMIGRGLVSNAQLQSAGVAV